MTYSRLTGSAIIAVIVSLTLISCAINKANKQRVVLGTKTVGGVLTEIKGGWSLNGLAFAYGDRNSSERIGYFFGKHVRMTGTLVKNKVICPESQLQCRTGEWYYTFEPLTSITVLKPAADAGARPAG